MKNILSIFIALAMAACYDLNHTQNDPPSLLFDKSTVSADGTSQVVIVAKTKNEFSFLQSLVISTSGGELFSLPITSASSGVSQLTLYPSTNEISVILRSSLIPDDHVRISAAINGLINNQTIKFIRSCPDEIHLLPDRTKLSISNTETSTLTLQFMRNDGSKVSQGTRVDLSLDDPSLATITSQTLFSDSAGTASTIITPIKVGTLTISAQVKNLDCTNAVKIIPLAIEVIN